MQFLMVTEKIPTDADVCALYIVASTLQYLSDVLPQLAVYRLPSIFWREYYMILP